jgi:hypothetical protein
VASFRRTHCYRSNDNGSIDRCQAPWHLLLCILAYSCETYSAHANLIPAYIVDAYGIRYSFTCLTNCPLSIQAALISSFQWLALPGQPTVAARLTPSLAKVACNARKDTTRLVLHVRFLRIGTSFQPNPSFDRAAVERRSLNSQCDEASPVCSGCRRSKLECSLSAPLLQDTTNSQSAPTRLNIDDLRLLYDWNAVSDTKFSDHNAKEAWRKQRGGEIELGLKFPYGTRPDPSWSHVTLRD